MKIIISLLPVLIFLLLLIYLDSFKLIKKQIIIACLIWGMLSAGFAYFANTYLLQKVYSLNIPFLSDMIAPVIEETLKMLLLIFLIKKNKIGFIIDGAIYGFAIGAGFSIIENIFYLDTLTSNNILLWIVRGFGTAIMHGGTISIMAIIVMNSINRKKSIFKAFILGWLIAIAIHYLFNLFMFVPVITTLTILIILPLIMMIIFEVSENSLRTWLDIEFDSEVKLLRMIKKGKLSETKSGSYLLSIKHHFSKVIVFDMLSYISLYLELSIRAKSNLLLKETGLPVKKISDLDSRLKELKSLRRNIGRTGLAAISPILKMSRKNLWKLTMLE